MFIGIDSSRNSTGALSDITNMSSADSTLNNTDVKRMVALALYKQKQNDVTPRTAIEQFLDANQSNALTPALVFDRGPVTRKRKMEQDLGKIIDSRVHTSNIEDDIEESNDISEDNNSAEWKETISSRRRSKRKSNVEVTVDDVNPDKDLTRPTNMSTTVNMTDFALTDDSTDHILPLSKKAKKMKLKSSGRKYFSEEDFNLTRKEGNKSRDNLPNETTLGKSLAALNDMSGNESEIIDERMERRRKLLEKRTARKKTAVNWDFSGIEPPSPKPSSSVNTFVSDEKRIHQRTANNVRIEITEASTGAEKTFNADDDDTVPPPSSEENTPVQAPKSSRRKVELNAEDFDDITITKEATQETMIEGEQFSALKNTLSPKSMATAEEESIQNIEISDQKQAKESSRRRSVYEGGLPHIPMESSLVLEQTKVFRPPVESTRIAESSTIDNSLSVRSPTSYPLRAKPGRDTSTPMEMKSFREGFRNQGLSKSTMPRVAEAEAEEIPRMSKTVNPTTEIDPHLPTPQIIEQIREARKSGVRSMRVSIYDRIPLDNVDDGTQTSPAVTDVPHQEEIIEAGCQVTPSLDVPADTETRKSLNNFTGVGSVSDGKIPLCEVTEEAPIDVNEDLESSQVQEIGPKVVDTNNINTTVDSLTEEIAIELQAVSSVDNDNIENFLDITESGRKNPSPVTERRNEVEAESIESPPSYHEDHIEPLGNEVSTVPGQSLEDPKLPDTSRQSKTLPSSKDQKELRQATLARYLGNTSTLSPLMTPTLSPSAAQQKTHRPKSIGVRAKPKDVTVFPAKNIKFEFQRFSRYKLKTEAEKALVETSEEFISKCMSRMSEFAAGRESNKIHLCDIKRMMVECGFVKNSEDDPKDLDFYQEIRDIARDSLRDELIPCDYGAGKIYPPKDCWELKGGKVPRRVTQSSSSVAAKRKADSVTRLKVLFPWNLS